MLNIRPATAADLEAMRELGVAAFGAARGTIGYLLEERHGILGGRTWADRYRAGVRWEDSFVAELEGRLAGFASYVYREQWRLGILKNNAVAPSYQGRGLSTALCRHVVTHLKALGASQLTVHTLCHIPAAMRVYEKVGFGNPVYGFVLSAGAAALRRPQSSALVRPAAASDERTVEQLCRRLGVPYDPKGTVFLAERDGSLAAFVRLACDRADRTAFVAQLCIDRDRDLGAEAVGGLIAFACADLAAQGTLVFSGYAAEKDALSRRAYEAAGFTVLCRDVTYTMQA